MMKFVRCLLFVCVAVLFANVSATRECTDEDWMWQYTTCRAGQRALIYYKNPSTDECSGGVEKPEDVFELPCDISCPAGTYLPPGTLECKGCPVGTYSLSGGVRIGQWKQFPEGEVAPGIKFDTWGAYTSSMDKHIAHGGWELVDEEALSIRSGKVNNSQASVLQLRTHLVKDGSVIFAFRVDCEQSYDGLEFLVDDSIVMNLTYGVHELSTVSFPLTRGYHTLEWRYSKDISVAQGEDAAYLRFVELDGTTFAADSCTPCPPGTASNVERASACVYCARNTYTDVSGRTQCSVCPSSQYAPVGSSSCFDRYQCTKDDYVPVFGPCSYDQSSGTYRRLKEYRWIEGTRCNHNDASLPDSSYVECPKCNPGMYRNSLGQCVDCPDGSVASGSDKECKLCSAGEESKPGIYIENWYRMDELPTMSTGCSGDCGTSGWVLNGSSIVSGWGHGNSVETFVEFNFTTLQRSKMMFNYTVNCPSWDCRMSMYDIGHYSAAYFSGQSNVDYVELLPGEHTVRFVYTRYHGSTVNNYAEIHNLVLYGSTYMDGSHGTGGKACSSCEKGFTSAEGGKWCKACPAGTTSNDEKTQCLECPENTFNDLEGGVCKACGTNVHADAGSSMCDVDCKFSPSEGITYDLGPLVKDGMYGPIYDSAQFAYFINLCSRFNASRSSSPAPCHSFYGDPIESYACQLYHDCTEGRTCSDYNIGSKLDIYPLEDRKGFNLTYTGGDYGCGGLNRVTNVTFMCKPGGGVGVPGAWPNMSTIEGPSCKYNILWESIYGCPLCTENDYTFVYGECKNGFRRKMYQWRDNPRACHDGVSLPPDEDVPSQCNGEVVCPVGHYYNETTNCTPCEPGTYSPGAGYAYYSFNKLPERFTSACGSAGGCTQFFTTNGKLHSGLGNSALIYTSQFFIDGFVNFTLSLFSCDPYKSRSSSHFNVFLDGDSVFGDLFKDGSLVASRDLSFKVPAGSHMISFEIDAYSQGTFAEIERMFIFGDRYAPLYCPVCGDGLVESDAAGGMCSPCSHNTVPNDDHTECVPCDDGKYTVDCKTCIPKTPCSSENYVALYTPCKNGKRSLHYVKVEPTNICEGGYVPPEDQDGLDCEECPVGMVRVAGEPYDKCVGCDTGYYFDIANGSCVEAHDGSIAVNSVTFFSSDKSSETELPEGWSTFAFMSTLPDSTVDGWRIGKGFVDSGALTGNGQYISVLQFHTTNVMTDLTLHFEYYLPDEARYRGSSLQLLVNDRLYDYVPRRSDTTRDSTVFVESSQITIPRSDSVTVRFVASIWTGSHNSVDSDVKIRNIIFNGIGNGVSKEEECPAGMESNNDHSCCLSCAAGTSNDESGRMCTECEQGTYTSVAGEKSCKVCYPGTESQRAFGSVRCVTSCYFNITDNVYNMTGLAGKVVGPVTSLATNRQFYLSVCDGVMKSGQCNALAKDEAQMYVCSPGEGAERRNFGSELEFVDSANDESDTTVVMKYHVSDGSNSACKDNVITTIFFRCDPSVGAGFPTALPSDECAPAFTWTSQYACRVCRRSDYEESLSKCEGGKQRRELYRMTTAKCNGEARIILEELECTDITVSLGVILGVGGLILVLAGVIVFVVWRNRQITVKYTKLLQSQEGDLEAMADEEANAERERKEADFSSSTATF